MWLSLPSAPPASSAVLAGDPVRPTASSVTSSVGRFLGNMPAAWRSLAALPRSVGVAYRQLNSARETAPVRRRLPRSLAVALDSSLIAVTLARSLESICSEMMRSSGAGLSALSRRVGSSGQSVCWEGSVAPSSACASAAAVSRFGCGSKRTCSRVSRLSVSRHCRTASRVRGAAVGCGGPWGQCSSNRLLSRCCGKCFRKGEYSK
mmetsp:Transcript_24573/g.60946  ORF Transcript_24573/g.60946 Transcript_24573/m.60946 type:complete len:206 (-) Transcript_24573:276-893(-)